MQKLLTKFTDYSVQKPQSAKINANNNTIIIMITHPLRIWFPSSPAIAYPTAKDADADGGQDTTRWTLVRTRARSCCCCHRRSRSLCCCLSEGDHAEATVEAVLLLPPLPPPVLATEEDLDEGEEFDPVGMAACGTWRDFSCIT